ncbi:aminopeptidase P family protein [Candidatus Peregrinibacteria bacterium]|nr:aminopeptidase P family protein [Candidatus Peregrinibacteria bacterium]
MNRIKKLQKQLSGQKFSSVLITKPENIYYLSGFTGSNGILYITASKATLITDFRYFTVAKKQLPKGVDVFDQKEGVGKLIKAKSVGFEECHITVVKLRALKKSLKGVKFLPSDYLVERMRMIKDKSEIQIIRKGVRIADECLRRFIKTVKVGQSEDEMEWNLLSIARNLGADDFSFPPIICFGKNTADVHHQKEDNKLKKGESILVDFGIKYKGYCTDMTRMIRGKSKVKSKDVEQKMYSIVLEANLTAIRAIKVGKKLSEVDRAARLVIEKAGYGKYFGHSTGHGVGLKIHEAPNVSELSKEIVKPGMVFTIEPGIYIEGVGGVRIEDMVYIDSKGKVEVLTGFGK